jgi:hypothetical protein
MLYPLRQEKETDMKLAEALLLRADMKKKMASLRERVATNAVVQEGTQPHEDPTSLMKEIKWVATVGVAGLQKQSDDLSRKLRELNAQIQETNWQVEI